MASSSGTSSGSSLIQNSGSEEDLQALMDQRKRKRMISNRESARRSRMRKQKHLDDLMSQVSQLRKENHQIVTGINITTQRFLSVEAANSILRVQISELSNRLESLNEIIGFLSSNNGVLGDSSTFNEPAADSFLNPWNMGKFVAMAEEFQAGICGENWWMNSSKSMFIGGLSPCSTVNLPIDHMGAYNGSWATADMVDLKPRSISCKESHNTTSVSDTSIAFLNSPKPQQANSNSGGSSNLIDSTLQMMGFGLSSSSSSSDWNQALLSGNGRTESYNSMLQEDMNSGGLNSSQIQKDWSPKSYARTAEDFSLDQQRLNPVNSSSNSPPTCQGFSTGFSMEPSASYGYPSTLIQSLFEPDHPQPQQVQSLFNNRPMNYLSPTAPNYGTNMSELSSPSWTKVSPLIKSCLQKQQASSMHFTNNTTYWNASPTGINDIRASFLPSSPSQFLLPAFEEKPNCPSLAIQPNREEVRDSVSVVKKGCEPAFKRPRIEAPSPLPTFKVRKEKLGDRITALQQLVSPFGKTDTASVLHEAIEYIKFLHDQATVLSNPYMKNGNPIQHQQAPEDKLNDLEGPKQDLRSRGLCLVPVSSTFPVANETTADFWTPTFGGTFR